MPLLCAAADTTPLFFPAQKNHVEALAQHFLYGLEDPHHLRVGDTMIDDRKVRFAVAPGRDVRLIFQWQAALITEGRLSLLDSTGKALWTQEFDPKKLSLVKDPAAAGELRTDLARLTTEVIPPATWLRIKSLPFINFCVSKEQPEAKLYLCSGTFYVSEKPGGVRTVLPRFAGTKESFVEINGAVATPQGIVYLNDPKQTLFMRARLESGASVEVLTHRGDIDFKDAIESDDGTSLLITSHGSEPVVKEGSVKKADGDTQVTLPRDRPTYYLTGEGGVPMRQEFSVSGTPPKEADRPHLDGETSDRTYRSSVTYTGTVPDKLAVAVGGTENAEVEDLGNHRFRWKLTNLVPDGKPQRRDLALTRAEPPTKFVASTDLRRGRASEVDAKLLTRLPNAFAHAEISYRQWVERLMWLPGDWSAFHWGWSLADRIHLKTPTDGPEIDQLSAELLFRAKAGFPYEVATWTGGLLYGQKSVNGTKSSGLGLDLGYEMPAPLPKYPWLQGRVDWLTWNLRLWPSTSGSGDDPRLATSWETGVTASKRLSPSSFARVNVGLSQYKTSLAMPKEGPQLDLGLGYGWNF